MSLTTKIEPEMIRNIAAKRFGLEISVAAAEKIHEKIISDIGLFLTLEFTRLRDEQRQRKMPGA